MKKHLFRIAALLMACCLLFAGCTTTDNGDQTTTSSTTTTTSTEAPTSTEGTTSTEPSSTDSTTQSSTSASSQTTASTSQPTTTKTTVKPTASKTTKPTTSKTTTTKSTTKSTTTTEEPTTTETTKPTLSAAQVKKLRDQVFFGYYRMGPLSFIALPNMEKEAAKGHMNLLDGDNVTYLNKLDELGDEYMSWVGIATTIFTFASSGPYFNYGWQDAVREKMNEIEEAGLMEHVLGFYFDEPLLAGIKRADFIEATKFLRETYPDLRVCTVFATNAIDPTVWSTGNDTVIDEATTKYLTDVGYNMYWDAKQHRDKYERLNASLKQRLGNNKARIWWVPCIMSYGGTSTEQYAIDHLEMCYEFLMEEENPGGLFCYAYDISNRDGDLGNIGFSEKQAEWTKLEARLIKIGKEIKSWNK